MKIIVVVSQSATANADQRDFEEQLVADLLMAGDGCEVTVIPDIAELESETTGLLCLEGIKGDLILLSWYAPRRAFEILASKGINGRFGKTSQDQSADPKAPATTLPPGVYDAMQRRIYCLQLSEDMNSVDIRREIGRIDEETSVKMVNVMGLEVSPPAAAVPLQAATDRPAPPQPAAPQPAATTDAEPAPAAALPAAEVAGESPIPVDDSDEAEEAALDRLVDQLDDLDL